jgi:hypothetical protein
MRMPEIARDDAAVAGMKHVERDRRVPQIRRFETGKTRARTIDADETRSIQERIQIADLSSAGGTQQTRPTAVAANSIVDRTSREERDSPPDPTPLDRPNSQRETAQHQRETGQREITQRETRQRARDLATRDRHHHREYGRTQANTASLRLAEAPISMHTLSPTPAPQHKSAPRTPHAHCLCLCRRLCVLCQMFRRAMAICSALGRAPDGGVMRGVFDPLRPETVRSSAPLCREGSAPVALPSSISLRGSPQP